MVMNWFGMPQPKENHVVYKERTGANTATVRRGSYEFEVFLDELEIPEEL
jgi:hypothetical protein